jgi:hypothetical protein
VIALVIGVIGLAYWTGARIRCVLEHLLGIGG